MKKLKGEDKSSHHWCVGSTLQRCPSKMPFKDALQWCPSKMPFKDALQWCPSNMPFKYALQSHPSKTPFNDALQRCPSRMPFNDALQICPSKTPFKDALQWCPSKMPFPCSTDSNDLAIKEVKNHNFISKDCQTSRKSSPGSRWPGDEGGVASDHLYSLGQGSPETEVLRIDEILYPAH